VITMTDDRERREREARQQREEELQAIPPLQIDRSKWPKNVRTLSLDDEGLGIDPDGRLYWNGKPVEIIGQRLDLTKTQLGLAIAVAVFTGIAALATAVQAWTAYHDWACRTGQPTLNVACPPKPVSEPAKQ
jgi:hypothetical protein